MSPPPFTGRNLHPAAVRQSFRFRLVSASQALSAGTIGSAEVSVTDGSAQLRASEQCYSGGDLRKSMKWDTLERLFELVRGCWPSFGKKAFIT